MHFTITQKVLLEVLAAVVLSSLVTWTIYSGLVVLRQAVHTVTDLKNPTSAAAYEMEINVVEIGLKVLKYLDTGNPQYRERVAKDAADFARFKAQYDRLAETAQGKALGGEIALLYNRYRALGDTLMSTKDTQETLFSRVGEHFDGIDEIIDDKLQALINPKEPGGLAKLAQSTAMEADVAEVGTWLGNYLRTPSEAYRARIFDNANDFREELRRFTSLKLTEAERQWVGQLAPLFDQTLAGIEEMLALNDALQKNVLHFLSLREELDDVLDDEIQVFTLQELNAAANEADQTFAQVIRRVAILLPVFIVFSFAAALLSLHFFLRKPVRRLLAGAAAVSQGDLSYRLEPRGRDEYAELTECFNLMVTRLETTTVSKERLEASRQELRQVNDDLRREIDERGRTERRLQVLSRQLLETQEAERRHLARELHDEIGQALTAVKINLLAVHEQPRAQLTARLEDSVAIVERILQQVRTLSLDLRPSLLDDLGLVAALRWYVAQQGQRAGLVVRFSADPVEMRWSPELETVCFRIVQEALTNVIRHAQARTVAVELRLCGAVLHLRVRDDGMGFELSALQDRLPAERSLGVLGMQERVLLAGGHFELTSEPGRGAEIHVWFHLNEQRIAI